MHAFSKNLSFSCLDTAVIYLFTSWAREGVVGLTPMIDKVDNDDGPCG